MAAKMWTRLSPIFIAIMYPIRVVAIIAELIHIAYERQQSKMTVREDGTSGGIMSDKENDSSRPKDDCLTDEIDLIFKDEPNAPKLPGREELIRYHARELPKDVLEEYDQNCVRFRIWREARGQLAKEWLTKLRGQFGESSTG